MLLGAPRPPNLGQRRCLRPDRAPGPLPTLVSPLTTFRCPADPRPSDPALLVGPAPHPRRAARVNPRRIPHPRVVPGVIPQTTATRPADPRVAWARHDPVPAPPRPATHRPSPAPTPDTATVQDTLQVPVNADNWMLLADTLAHAHIDLAVGDVDALRRTAKLDQDLVKALARWMRGAAWLCARIHRLPGHEA